MRRRRRGQRARRPLPTLPCPPLQAAQDFRADPMLYEACKDDSASLCKDVKNGGGRVQACLVSGEGGGWRERRGGHLVIVSHPQFALPSPRSLQRDKRLKLSWACEEQLFRQEMENADDVRLSVRLFARCMPDKRKVRCTRAGAGGGRGVCAEGVKRGALARRTTTARASGPHP